MKRMSGTFVGLWLLLILLGSAVLWIVTRPAGRDLRSAPSARVDLFVSAGGDLTLDGKYIVQKDWIRRLRVAAIQVPQPPIRIHAAEEVAYGVVHKAYHSVWAMHLANISYVVGHRAAIAVPLTVPDEREVRDWNLNAQPVLLDVDAIGDARWNGTPVADSDLRAQASVMSSIGRPLRLMVRASDDSPWHAVADALWALQNCSVCRVGVYEESAESAGPWLPPPPQVIRLAIPN